jgi:NAD(P)-dependent dehydrogenase (short-subunit alcohol dehydrogenase family)
MSSATELPPQERSARFRGRVAIITGAARGIGFATAEALGRDGAHLVLFDRDAAALATAQRSLAASGVAASSLILDVTEDAALPEAADGVARDLGRIDILVNNAGANVAESIAECTEASLRRTLDLNVTAVFGLSRLVASHMAKGGGGVIVNLASVLSFIARPTIPAYVTSKGAVAALTRALAVELGPKGIRCNAVAPGYILTEATAFLRRDEAFQSKLLARTPLERWGKPEEIARAVAFLASDEASFVTGHILVADGGLSIAL